MALDLRTLIYFFIVIIVVVGLTIFIVRRLPISETFRNVILAVEGLVFLLWFLQIVGLV